MSKALPPVSGLRERVRDYIYDCTKDEFGTGWTLSAHQTDDLIAMVSPALSAMNEASPSGDAVLSECPNCCCDDCDAARRVNRDTAREQSGANAPPASDMTPNGSVPNMYTNSARFRVETLKTIRTILGQGQ